MAHKHGLICAVDWDTLCATGVVLRWGSTGTYGCKMNCQCIDRMLQPWACSGVLHWWWTITALCERTEHVCLSVQNRIKSTGKQKQMLLAGNAAAVFAAVSLMLYCSEQTIDCWMLWPSKDSTQNIFHCTVWWLMSASKPIKLLFRSAPQ